MLIVEHMQRVFIWVCLIVVSSGAVLYGQRPQPYPNPVESAKAKQLVEEFFHAGFDPAGIKDSDVDRFSVDKFAEFLQTNVGSPFWPTPQPYEILDVYKIYPTDSAAIVTARTVVDSLPYWGKVHVDWVWFVRIVEGDGWRISSVRRTTGLLKAMGMMHFIDSTADFPDRIKPVIAREEGMILLSNAQLRAEFERSRPALDQLVATLATQDSIQFIERTGDRVSQFNYTMIDWKMAAQDLPQEVLEEYMQNASEAEKQQMEIRLRAAEKQKAEGYRMLENLGKKAQIEAKTLETVVDLMKKGQVKFVNTDLPWEGAVLMTVAGKVNDAIGFLYSPKGQLPLISPEEYFYLEDLGGGWWIFRAT